MTASLGTAISAIRDNRREEGRKQLNLLIQQNPNDEGAWLWMSEVVENDQQRAKCLQHVLMINPNNSLARHGLTRLGHDVPDSSSKQAAKTRPITPQIAQAVAVTQADKPASQPLDPKEITQEMPFTPLREPFSDGSAPQVVIGDSPEPNLTVQPPQRQSDTKQRLRILSLALQEKMGRTHDSKPSLPSLVKQADNSITVHENTGDDKRTKDTKENPATVTDPPKPEEAASPAVPLPDFEHALTQAQPPNGSAPSQPIPVVAAGPIYVSPTQVTRPVNLGQQAYHPSQVISQPQPANGGAMIIQLTRPSQPYQLPHAQTVGMPASTPYQSEPVPVIHTNSTIGMPYQPQPVMAGHAQVTLGMPMPAQAPMPNSHDTASMIPAQAAMMPPSNSPQTQAHAGGPSDQALIAAWQNGTYQANPYAPQIDEYEEDDYEEDEVNLIAVFVFGFFSITALGGLGVLTIIGVTAGF